MFSSTGSETFSYLALSIDSFSRFQCEKIDWLLADGYEICFVEAVAFYQLAEPKYDVIDFASRATRGGDGAAPPKSEKLQHTAGVTAAVTTEEEVAEAVGAAGDGLILLDFGAG